MGQPAVNATLRAAVEMGLIESIARNGGGKVSAKELAVGTGHHQLLIGE